ncbi:DDE superfamily endonuclease [Hirsutella rhossiliensis]
MDEAGIMEGLGRMAWSLAVLKTICTKEDAWFSGLDVVHRGKSVQQQWFPEDLSTFSDWQFTATKNGWTSDQTAVEWLEKVFIPRTQPPDPSERRLLVGFLSLLTDSSPVGKQNFLSCYQKAREQALTVSNIKGGWKATAEKKEEGGHEPEFEVRQY